MMTALKDHYKVLGLDKKANEDEVKRAYRSLAKQFHPDKNSNPGAEEKFKEIGAAYDVLKDEQKRRTYDMQRDTEQLRRNNEKMRAEKAARDASTAKASSNSTPKTSHREEQAAAGPSGRQYSSSDRSTRFSFFTSDDEEAGQSNAKRKGRRKTTAGSGSEQQQNAQRKQQGANVDYTYKLFSENVLGAMLGNLFGGMGRGSMTDTMFSGAEPPLRQTSAPPGAAGWDGGTGWEAPSNFMFSSSIPMPSMYTMGPASTAFFSGPQSSQDFFTESQTAQTFASGPQRSQRQQRREQEDDMADMYDWSKPMWTDKPKRGARSGHRRGSSQPSGSGIRCSYCGRGVPAADLPGHEEVCRRLHGH